MSATLAARVAVLGIFAADLVFRAERMPDVGETLLGRGFSLGPGGKGSNQAVAAARAGGDVGLITRLGRDSFAEIALGLWREAGIRLDGQIIDPDRPTGTAFIFVSTVSGDNAIIVEPGAAGALSPADVCAKASEITRARVFLTQLEQPLDAAETALRIAREAGVMTILNPAPATTIGPSLLPLCDVVTPNESEAEALTGIAVQSPDAAVAAAACLISRGARAAIVTLGEKGALIHDGRQTSFQHAFQLGPTVDTTGAGDAFSGALAVALGEGQSLAHAARFAAAAAGLSVTRAGAARSIATRAEIDTVLLSSVP